MKAFRTWACLSLLGWPIAVTAAPGDTESPSSTVSERAVERDKSSPRPNAPEVPLRAELSGPSSCNSADYLLGEILRRTPQARRATGGEIGWTLRVVVAPQGSRFGAKLTVLANEGNWIERELVAPTCNDAIEALSVVVSVLVETAVEQIQTDQETHGGATADDTAKEPAKANVPLPYVAGGVWVPWLDEPNYFERRGVTPIPTRYVRAITASVELDAQVVSQSVIGLGLGFELSRWHPNLFNPSYGLSLGWAAGDMSKDTGSKRVEMEVSRLDLRTDLCPLELLRRLRIGLRPCARGDFGVVYVRYDVPPGPVSERYRHTERYWQFRASPFLRFSYSPIAGAEVRADLGLDVAIRRPEYRTGLWESDGPNTLFRPSRTRVHSALSLAVDW